MSNSNKRFIPNQSNNKSNLVHHKYILNNNSQYCNFFKYVKILPILNYWKKK